MPEVAVPREHHGDAVLVAGLDALIVADGAAGLDDGGHAVARQHVDVVADAFFPFRDGIDAAAAAGVTCVIQPGGSIRDDEVIAAADEHGIAMLFTDMRHFRH